MKLSVSGLKDKVTFLFCFLFFSLKLTPQEPTKDYSLFNDSSSFVKRFLNLLLGVLGGLLLIGTAWEIFIRKKGKAKQDVELGKRRGQAHNL